METKEPDPNKDNPFAPPQAPLDDPFQVRMRLREYFFGVMAEPSDEIGAFCREFSEKLRNLIDNENVAGAVSQAVRDFPDKETKLLPSNLRNRYKLLEASIDEQSKLGHSDELRELEFLKSRFRLYTQEYATLKMWSDLLDVSAEKPPALDRRKFLGRLAQCFAAGSGCLGAVTGVETARQGYLVSREQDPINRRKLIHSAADLGRITSQAITTAAFAYGTGRYLVNSAELKTNIDEAIDNLEIVMNGVLDGDREVISAQQNKAKSAEVLYNYCSQQAELGSRLPVRSR